MLRGSQLNLCKFVWCCLKFDVHKICGSLCLRWFFLFFFKWINLSVIISDGGVCTPIELLNPWNIFLKTNKYLVIHCLLLNSTVATAKYHSFAAYDFCPLVLFFDIFATQHWFFFNDFFYIFFPFLIIKLELQNLMFYSHLWRNFNIYDKRF